MMIPSPTVPLDWVDIIVILELLLQHNATTLLHIL